MNNAPVPKAQQPDPLAGVAAAIEAGKRIGALESMVAMDIQGVPHLAMPEGQEIEVLEHLLPRPKRIKANRAFHEHDSFAAYVNEFKDDNSRLYGDVIERKIMAILDDHEAERAAKDAQSQASPRWCDHNAVLVLSLSDEWNAWAQMNKKGLGHVDFVEFLQEQIGTIARPDASSILQAARTFSASRSAKIEQVIPVEGGDLSVAFTEEIRGAVKSGEAALPSSLVLALRPFRCGIAYEVKAQIRWRLSREGGLTFSFALLETERVLEKAFADVREAVEKAVGDKVLV